MHPVIAQERVAPTSLVGRLQAFVSQVGETTKAYAGDERLMQAFVSAAANIIVADAEVASEEFATALAGVRAHPVIAKGYDALLLEGELYGSPGVTMPGFPVTL